MGAGNLDAAERTCRRTLELEPTYAGARRYRRRLRSSWRHEQAIAQYLGIRQPGRSLDRATLVRLKADRTGGMRAFEKWNCRR